MRIVEQKLSLKEDQLAFATAQGHGQAHRAEAQEKIRDRQVDMIQKNAAERIQEVKNAAEKEHAIIVRQQQREIEKLKEEARELEKGYDYEKTQNHYHEEENN